MTDKAIQRPDFAIAPGPGQESAWDYPRPPALRAVSRMIEVYDGENCLGRTTGSYKLMETASPPAFYLPGGDVDLEQLVATADRTWCEWKGAATYLALRRAPQEPVAWTYERPRPLFAALEGYFSFYPGRVACFIDGERVIAQAGRFYGGWITSEVVGPFKGEPGTGHW